MIRSKESLCAIMSLYSTGVPFWTWVLVLHCSCVSRQADTRDVQPQTEHYLPDYDIYHNLSSIETHLTALVSRNPDYMKIDWFYRSKQQRPQFVLHVTNFTDSSVISASDAVPFSKVRILLSYGEHAREFLPVESLFHLLNSLSNGLAAAKSSPANAFSYIVLSKVDLFVVALMNPDGRNYVESSSNYCWRGTSSGVDLNRNFDWNYGHRGSSSNQLDEEYRGTHPFSEPECQVLLDLTSKIRFDAFVSLHSGTRQIYIPYADTNSKSKGRKPHNYQTMLELAELMSQATGLSFSYGLAYQLNDYTADGTIFDYMAGIRQIPFSYAIELWGDGDSEKTKCFDLFNPESQDLQNALQEIHPLYQALFTYLIEWKNRQIHNLYDPVVSAPPLTFGYLLLLLVITATVGIGLRYRLHQWLILQFQRRRVISLRSLSSTFVLMQGL